MNVKFPPANRPKRAPLRTFAEIAEMLGVSSHKLSGLLGAHPNGAPTPHLIHRSYDTPRCTWYSPSEFRTWFNTLPKK